MCFSVLDLCLSLERSKDIDTQERKREYAEQSTKGTEKMLHAKTRQGSHWRSEAVNKGRRSFYPGVLDDDAPHWTGTSVVATTKWQLEEQFESCQVDDGGNCMPHN